MFKLVSLLPRGWRSVEFTSVYFIEKIPDPVFFLKVLWAIAAIDYRLKQLIIMQDNEWGDKQKRENTSCHSRVFKRISSNMIKLKFF